VRSLDPWSGRVQYCLHGIVYTAPAAGNETRGLARLRIAPPRVGSRTAGPSVERSGVNVVRRSFVASLAGNDLATRGRGEERQMIERVAKAAFRGDNDGDGDSILTGLSGVVIVVLVALGIWYFARHRG
jgi:hypothetical protein